MTTISTGMEWNLSGGNPTTDSLSFGKTSLGGLTNTAPIGGPHGGDAETWLDDLHLPAHEEVSCLDRFLGDEKISRLCTKLRITPKKKLVLRGNSIGPSGAKAISELLREQESLEHLSFEWNQLGGMGTAMIAEALAVNRSLLFLDLRNNHVTTDAAVALAEMLSKNTSLRTLDLRWNQIEDRGLLAFKSCILERVPSLTLLFTGNLISQPTVATIEAWLRQRQELDKALPEPAPEPTSAPPAIEAEFLQKEILRLRRQLGDLQNVFADTQRQLDSSALRVTELEQQTDRDAYALTQANEALSHALLRISCLTDERAALTASWERSRAELVESMGRTISEQESEIKSLYLTRDTLQDRVNKLEDENDSLQHRYNHLEQQLATDRIVAQNELKNASTRINDLSLSETKLKAENTALKSTNERLVEKAKMLAEELEFNRTEHARLVAAEHAFYVEETERLRAEHLAAMNPLLERNKAQAAEIAALQEANRALREELTKQRQELEMAFKVELAAMRETERRNYEAQIADYQQRLSALTISRAELEARCEALIAEIATLRAEYEELLRQLRSQVSGGQDELTRLRDAANAYRVQIAALENELQKLKIDNADLRRRLEVAERQAESWQREAATEAARYQTCSSSLEKLRAEFAALQESRASDFALIASNVLAAARNQFDALRVDLRLPANAGVGGGPTVPP